MFPTADNLGLLALREGKGDDIRRTVDIAIFPVDDVDVRVVRECYAHLGALRPVEASDRLNRAAHRRPLLLGGGQFLRLRPNLNLHTFVPASSPTCRMPRQCASRPRDG